MHLICRPALIEQNVTLNDQSTIHLRPGKTRDFEMLWTMLSTLSEDSLRFLHNRFNRDEMETWMKNIDYDTLLPIVAVVKDQATGKKRIAARLGALRCQALGLFRHEAAVTNRYPRS